MILTSILVAVRLLMTMLAAAGRVPFTIIATAVAFTAFGDPDPIDLPLRLVDWVQQWAIGTPTVADAAAAPFTPEAQQRPEP
jgi:hypothetical protein